MFAAGVVAIGLLLGSRGEAPREEKFLGVLVAQADAAAPAVDVGAKRTELALLIQDRPTYIPVGVAALLVVVVAGLELISLASDRAKFDARIEELRARPPAAPPEPALPPPSVRIHQERSLVLARF